MSQKTRLILTGVARSGTTAMAELLNAHPRICIGIERFKFQYLRKNNYAADLFERDRFFDFRPEDTNLTPAARPHWQPTYDTMAAKWDAAEVIGDKVPDLMPVLADFMSVNPDYRYMCILRNLKDVGLSWQSRADRPRDAWPVGKDFAMACKSWAEQNRILHDMVSDRILRRQILLLDYDHMYGDIQQTEAAIMGFLGIDPDPAFHEVLERHAEFALARQKRSVPKQYADLYKAVDMGHARGLRKIARAQAEAWSVSGNPASLP